MGEMVEGFGNFLESLRGNQSLREAAKKSGLSYGYIRDLELEKNRSTEGKIKPTPDTLKKLSIAYNYPYLELLKMAGVLPDNHKLLDGLDFDAVWYIKVEEYEIIICISGIFESVIFSSFAEFDDFINQLQENSFYRIDTNTYTNFKNVIDFEEQTGKIYFCENHYIIIASIRQSKFRNKIIRNILMNNPQNTKFNSKNKKIKHHRFAKIFNL